MDLLESLTLAVQWIFETSLKASVLIVIILCLQWVLRHRLPAKWRYTLWGLLILRLVIPFELESRLSIFNLFPVGREEIAPVAYNVGEILEPLPAIHVEDKAVFSLPVVESPFVEDVPWKN